MIVQIKLITVLAIMLVGSQALNWQGTGSMTIDNLTIINNYINTNLPMGSFNNDVNSVAPKLAIFSDYLNGLWGSAWNLVAIYNNNGG
jgi:hypothetical protein